MPFLFLTLISFDPGAETIMVSRCTLPPTGAELGSLGNETGLLGDIVHPDYDRDTAGGAWLDNGTHAAVMCHRTLWYHCGTLRPGRSQLELHQEASALLEALG